MEYIKGFNKIKHFHILQLMSLSTVRSKNIQLYSSGIYPTIHESTVPHDIENKVIFDKMIQRLTGVNHSTKCYVKLLRVHSQSCIKLKKIKIYIYILLDVKMLS